MTGDDWDAVRLTGTASAVGAVGSHALERVGLVERSAKPLRLGGVPHDHQGRMTQEVPQFAGANSGNKLWSISPCAGDFNAEIIDAEMGPGCIKRDQFSFIDSFNWGGAAAASDPQRCALQPHTTYFLNIVWTNDQAGTAPAALTPNPSCVAQRCGGNFTPAGLYTP